jgi:hypothetical protein
MSMSTGVEVQRRSSMPKQPNSVTAESKTKKPLLFSAELTSVNEQRKVAADAVLLRLSSYLLVVAKRDT